MITVFLSLKFWSGIKWSDLNVTEIVGVELFHD